MKMKQLFLILLLNTAGLALFLGWYLSEKQGFWFQIDTVMFYFFNQELINNQIFLWIVAVTNSHIFDGITLIAMSCLMFSFWLKENTEGRRRIIMMGLVILIVMVVVDQLAQNLMPVKRASPSLSFPDAFRVSNFLHFSTKDASKDSFPGDHGMILLIFSAFVLRYFGKKMFSIVFIIVIVFIFPRIMIGAHWLTDVIVGSLSAVLITIPWVLMTPLSDCFITFFDRYFYMVRNKIKKRE